MQNNTPKKLYFFLLFSLFFSQFVHSQDISKTLKGADSLFAKRKIRGAYTIYDSIYSNTGRFTPAMLLKMAYIKENTGEYDKALYFLSLYNQDKPSVKVLRKMESLADEYGVAGYHYSDLEYFLAVYNQFYRQINITLMVITVVFFAYNTSMQGIKRSYPRSRVIFFLFLLAGTFYLMNFGLPIYKGVVAQNHSYVMDEPSSGSNVISQLPKGTKLNIIGKNDVWYRIRYGERLAYIREANILVISHHNKEWRQWQEYFDLRRIL